MSETLTPLNPNLAQVHDEQVEHQRLAISLENVAAPVAPAQASPEISLFQKPKPAESAQVPPLNSTLTPVDTVSNHSPEKKNFVKKFLAKTTARFAGKAALLGHEIDKQPPEIDGKSIRKTIEVASNVSEATIVKVRHGNRVAKELFHQTLKSADARAANMISAYHDNQMRRHTRKAGAHRSKATSDAHAASNASFNWF